MSVRPATRLRVKAAVLGRGRLSRTSWGGRGLLVGLEPSKEIKDFPGVPTPGAEPSEHRASESEGPRRLIG